MDSTQTVHEKCINTFKFDIQLYCFIEYIDDNVFSQIDKWIDKLGGEIERGNINSWIP
jgi:lipopolysaccharide biosynthesis glycosyltransferase